MTFSSTDGCLISVKVLDNDRIVIRKSCASGETTVQLTNTEAHHILGTKPTQPKAAWHVARDLLISPVDVDKFAEALAKVLRSRDAQAPQGS